MTPEQLQAAGAYLIQHAPTADLVRNDVGNLAILVDGDYAGYVDLVDAGVRLFALDQPVDA